MSAGALTIGSLFSGYLGLDLGVRSVFPGAREAWVSDVDKGANKILAHRAPGAPNLGDITAIDWAAVEPVDIFTGGSPCPDLSTAGRRAGMAAGTRSGLWGSMREAVAALKPRLVVWENVRGALSASATSELEHCPGCMGGAGRARPPLRALGRVLGDLADLGYDAQWYGLRAADLGACHARFRVFVVAYPNDPGRREPRGAVPVRAPHPGPQHVDPDPAGLTPGRLLPTPVATNPNDRESVETWEARRRRTKERVGNGNGFGTPLSAAMRLLPTPLSSDANGADQHGTGGADLRTAVQLLPTPTTEPMTGNGHARNLGAEVKRWGDYAAAIASHERLMGRPAPSPTEPGAKGKPRLSVRFVEWVMGLPDGWVADVPGLTRNEALRALGNGVVPAQAAHAVALCLSRAEAIRAAA